MSYNYYIWLTEVFILKYLFKLFVLFSLGGIFYLLIELLWRGHSHWTMFILGGSCFLALGLLNEFYDYSIPLILQMFFGSIIITLFEFITGCIVNLYLGMNVWSYADLPYNILGQICLPYMILWFFLSGCCIIADDWLRYALFEEEKPKYRII